MGYRLSGKSLSVARMMVRGKNAFTRLKHIVATPQGTIVVTPAATVKVSLPEGEPQPAASHLYPQTQLDGMKFPAPESNEVIDMPEGERAEDSPAHMVPKIDAAFFRRTPSMKSIVVNAEMLKKILQIACEVNDDSQKMTRLTFDFEHDRLRLDTYRQPGKQEMAAVLMGMKYDGEYIPEETSDEATFSGVKPKQNTLHFQITEGRKFR